MTGFAQKVEIKSKGATVKDTVYCTYTVQITKIQRLHVVCTHYTTASTKRKWTTSPSTHRTTELFHKYSFHPCHLRKRKSEKERACEWKYGNMRNTRLLVIYLHFQFLSSCNLYLFFIFYRCITEVIIVAVLINGRSLLDVYVLVTIFIFIFILLKCPEDWVLRERTNTTINLQKNSFLARSAHKLCRYVLMSFRYEFIHARTLPKAYPF
jgi:hypothetical protein